MLKSDQAVSQFTEKLLAWFALHGRKELPWQQNITPYRVWVSEIMLQQTQVTTVIPYYQRFMQRFADISALATAPQDEVLHLWTGLGYYARARNLQRAAQLIEQDFNGIFPLKFDDLLSLPGIGRSTAGAILAIADQQHHAILDGNVKRVLSRYALVSGWTGLKKVETALWEIAERFTPEQNVADYTQAIMDLGATVCTRSKPRCHDCPVNKSCCACRDGVVANYPTPKPKKTLPVRQSLLLMVVDEKGSVLLEQRPPTGIWGGLWSFPQLEEGVDIPRWCEQNFNLKIDQIQAWPKKRHTFSHFYLDYTPVYAKLTQTLPSVMEPNGRVWYNLQKPDERGLAAPIKRLLVQLGGEISAGC